MITLLNNTSEGTFTIPAGNYIESILQRTTTEEKVIGGIKYGTSHGDNNIVGAHNLERLNLDVPVLSYEEDTVVYFDAVNDWNGASVDIYVVIKSLVE